MPQHKFYCGECENRLPDLTSDVCRLLSYKSLNVRSNKLRLLDHGEYKWEERRTKEIENQRLILAGFAHEVRTKKKKNRVPRYFFFFFSISNSFVFIWINVFYFSQEHRIYRFQVHTDDAFPKHIHTFGLHTVQDKRKFTAHTEFINKVIMKRWEDSMLLNTWDKN